MVLKRGKAGMPEQGRFVEGVVDPVTGLRWVHVTPAMARAHPRGRLNLALYAIVLLLAAMAALRLAVLFTTGGGVWLVAEIALMGLGAVALFLRMPPGRGLALVGFGMALVDFLLGPMLAVSLVEALLAVVAGFYLFTGARPNLIYRHRYLARGAPGERVPGDGGDV